jgi:hypothetical protein
MRRSFAHRRGCRACVEARRCDDFRLLHFHCRRSSTFIAFHECWVAYRVTDATLYMDPVLITTAGDSDRPRCGRIALLWRENSLLSLCERVDVFDSFIAPAGSRYEASMVDDGDGPAAVGDELAFLQPSRCRVNAESPHA